MAIDVRNWKRPVWPAQGPPFAKAIDTQHPHALGLVGCWSLPNPNNLVSQLVGQYLNGADAGKPGAIEWYGSYFPNASAGVLLCPTESRFNTAGSTGAITVAAWVRPIQGGGAAAGARIVDRASDNATTGGFGLSITAAGEYRFRVAGSAGLVDTTGLRMHNGDIQHVVGSVQNTAGKIYVDGALITSAATGAYPSSVLPIGIGNGASVTTTQFIGWIGDVRIWNRQLSDGEVFSLFDPVTRWALYQIPQDKQYFFLAPNDAPVVQDTPPSQFPRPRYITLNEFSPQARGLVAWMPSIDGAMTSGMPDRAVVPRISILVDGTATSPATQPPLTAASDFGRVAISGKQINASLQRELLYYQTPFNVTGLTDFTAVYWIYPLPSVFGEATYWSTQRFTVMTNADFLCDGQTVTFTQNPHIIGRWQMITVSRTVNTVTIWRDQEPLINTTAAGGTAMSSTSLFNIGGFQFSASVRNDAVNALWADFRIYNRAFTQTDVNYAYNPKTRWDYYWQPKYKPYQDVPIIPISSGFLSRLASLGAG